MPLLETLPFLALQALHSVQLLLPLPLVELPEMLLQVHVGLAFPAADGADVRLRRRLDPFPLADVVAALLAAVLDDPLGEVDEGVAVGVGGDVDHFAEFLGHRLQGQRRLVRRPPRRLVVQIPQDDDFLRVRGVDSVPGLHHVDFLVGEAGFHGAPFVGFGAEQSWGTSQIEEEFLRDGFVGDCAGGEGE